MNRGQIKTNVRVNLNDLGVTFWDENDLNDSIQDAYDDIVCLSQCISSSVILPWLNNLSYLNFKEDYGVADYLATVAIFNYATNRWLRDDLTLRDFDRIRRDWENWIGTPQFWTPTDPLRIAITPKYNNIVVSSGAFNYNAFTNAFYINSPAGVLQFKLVYWSQAPALASDSSTFLTATDVQNMFEFYVTADMLEQALEFDKASEYWGKYYDSLVNYSSRVKRNNKTDLLLRV